MAQVTILGAGDMGTALTTPLVHNRQQVRIWGTTRDSAIVAALQAGEPHPRLALPIDPGVRVFAAADAAAALDDAEIVVVAITSDAVRGVLTQLAHHLRSARVIMTVAKGFDAGADGGAIQLLPATITELCPAPIVAVGGPSKANEVARGLPTAVVFGGTDAESVNLCHETFATPDYQIETTADIIGLEVAAAMKNAYAIGLGVADGLERRTGDPYHNFRAALFSRAIEEMARLATLLGGHQETVTGLAGCGDLQVTMTSGRNRLLGDRIGAGETVEAAARALANADTTIEGYPAVAFGYRLAHQLVRSGVAAESDFRLLDALWQILYDDAPLQTLWTAMQQPGGSASQPA